MRKNPSGVRSPDRNGRSRSSTSVVSSCALSASVRHNSTVGTPSTSDASRAAFRVRMCWLIGTSTLPPRWPHFFSLASWSSKCTPAAPAAIIVAHQLVGVQRAAEPGLRVGDHRRHPLRRVTELLRSWAIWSARRSALLIRLTTCGTESTGIQRLVRIHGAGAVRVRRHLPAGQVDRLQPGLDLLQRLVAGQRAERVDVFFAVQQLPEALGALLGQRVLDGERATELGDVGRGVVALDAGETIRAKRGGKPAVGRKAGSGICAHLGCPLGLSRVVIRLSNIDIALRNRKLD